MWYPPPVWVPIHLEQSLHRPSTCTTMMWPVLPRAHNASLDVHEIVDHLNHPVPIDEGRKFVLNKSVFDLVKVSHYLELTDPKLLGWYLCLPVEDRKLIQEEGGLLRFLQIHPALEVSRHIVHLKQQIIGNCLPVTDISSKLTKSRQTTHHGVLRCLNCGTSCLSSTKKCSCCNSPLLNLEDNRSTSEEENTLRLLPNNMREELTLLKAHALIENSNMSATQISSVTHQKQKHSDKEHKLCKVWKDGKWYVKDDRKYKDPSAQASFSLDRELEMETLTQGVKQGNRLMSAESSGHFPNSDQETTSEYYSFNNTSVFVTANRGSTEATTVGELVENPEACSAEHRIMPGSESHLSEISAWTDLTSQNFNQWTESDKYHGMRGEYQVQSSIKASTSGSVLGTPVSQSTCAELTSKASLTVNRAVDASSDFRACFTCTQATEIGTDYFEKPKRNVSTGIDFKLINYDQGTRTVQRFTSEKSTITEVYMSDLDAICEEFERLKVMETELKHLKSIMASSDLGSTRGPESDRQKSCCAAAISRATQAELRLLTLQFAMCKQHCWRRFYTSPLGETALQGADVLPEIMTQTLKRLENDYLEMKKKIKGGVSLDDLKPLSVDTLGLTEGTVYCPALIFVASMEDSLLETRSPATNKGVEDGSQMDPTNAVLKIETVDRGHPGNNTSPQCKSGTSSKSVGGKRSRAMSVHGQQSGDTKPGSAKDLNSSEAWFDAEEHLEADSLDCKEDQRASEDSKKGAVDVMEDECSVLSVTNLPNNLTECELQRLFERYHSSKVCISTKNRVAVVSVKSPTDAEAAVQQLHGHFIQGHMLHVEHIHKSPADGQGLIKEACAELSPAAHKESAREKQNISKASQALRSSLEKLTNIYDTPNASGTCVPQHYCTMGSFDTIMGRLLERHPQMDRQRIVKALLELQAKNQGVLSGLPLRVIVDITSDLLSQSASE